MRWATAPDVADSLVPFRPLAPIVVAVLREPHAEVDAVCGGEGYGERQEVEFAGRQPQCTAGAGEENRVFVILCGLPRGPCRGPSNDA
jgi:hypothetical protein